MTTEPQISTCRTSEYGSRLRNYKSPSQTSLSHYRQPFSSHTVQLLKLKTILYAAPPSSATHKFRTENSKRFAVGALGAQRSLRLNLQESMDASEHVYTLDTLKTVHYKTNKSSITRTAQHAIVCRKDNERLTQNWRNEISLSDKNEELCERFIYKLSEFAFM